MNEYRSLHEAYQFLYKKYNVGDQDVEFDFSGLVNPFMKMDDMGLTGNKSYEKKINDIVDKQIQDAQNKALEKQLEDEKRIQNELNEAKEKKFLEEKKKLRIVSVGDDLDLERRGSLEAEALWQQEVQKEVEAMDKKRSSKKKRSKKIKKEQEHKEISSVKKAEQKFLDSQLGSAVMFS